MTAWMLDILAYWRAGGLLLPPIALVAVCIWAYILRLDGWLRDSTTSVRRAEQYLLGRGSGTAASGLRPRGREEDWAPVWQDAAEALETSNDPELARRRFETLTDARWAFPRKDLFMLKTLTAAAPLLGLLGTVGGMVTTFAAVSSQGADGPGQVAGGISAALITTQFGLIAALPGVFGFIHLGRGLSRLRGSIGRIGMLIYISKSGREVSC